MTIEERSKNYADNYVVGDAAIIVNLLHKVALESYQVGATEQDTISRADERKKVIEKACEWLKNELYTYHNEVDKRYPNDVKSASYFTAEELIEEFRKAMEDKIYEPGR